MAVFIPLYNITLQSLEYSITNDRGLITCLPFGTEVSVQNDVGLKVITGIGSVLSLIFLVLHLVVFKILPNLPSLNLASLSLSLLVLCCSFFVDSFLSDSDVPCVVLAVVIHYTLLTSFCWMLTIGYDINRVIRNNVTQLEILPGNNFLF
jgi:hypothetical protein